jgi:ABC-type transport system substrate-binding protein
MPGAGEILPNGPQVELKVSRAGRLRLVYSTQDALAGRAIARVKKLLAPMPVNAVAAGTGFAGARADLVLLGWSPKIFDAYNTLDLFPCGSAFNVAHWCEPSYDALMRRAVRTLDDHARWAIERQILAKLQASGPVIALSNPPEYVWLRPGVRGFSWSPIGYYELSGMTRS